ncbi:MAG TPA: response regulator [Candidatus Aquicultoraceae bacterium]|nr:response regulator [Candidatus Aquicultoraceae bacterium]
MQSTRTDSGREEGRFVYTEFFRHDPPVRGEDVAMGKRVLVVEDEIINAMALAEALPGWGISVVDTVTSGEDAIRIAEEQKPDVVLMDIGIHGSVDGVSAAREIIGRLGIPVIFMTGYDDEETIRRAKSLNPLAYLVKPLDAKRLMELLQGI